MTNIGDVIRQVETAMNDTLYPPTSHEREVYHKILSSMYVGPSDALGSR